jgi:hypothetical protein
MNRLKSLHKAVFAIGSVAAVILFLLVLLPGRFAAVSSQSGWEPINNQASLNGTNLTYYRGTTAQQCQADCGGNANCKGFTLIRAGAYNRNDPPMCYLLSAVTQVAAHSCCISGIKKGGGKGIFSGDWFASDWGNITFNQNGNNVNGSYTRGSGTINGNTSGNRLNATWQQQGRSGTVYFIIQSNGTLEGKYCDGKGCSPENGTSFSGRKL